MFEVILENVGTVYLGSDLVEAQRTYDSYRLSPPARGAGEHIFILGENDVIEEGYAEEYPLT